MKANGVPDILILTNYMYMCNLFHIMYVTFSTIYMYIYMYIVRACTCAFICTCVVVYMYYLFTCICSNLFHIIIIHDLYSICTCTCTCTCMYMWIYMYLYYLFNKIHVPVSHYVLIVHVYVCKNINSFISVNLVYTQL